MSYSCLELVPLKRVQRTLVEVTGSSMFCLTSPGCQFGSPGWVRQMTLEPLTQGAHLLRVLGLKEIQTALVGSQWFLNRLPNQAWAARLQTKAWFQLCQKEGANFLGTLGVNVMLVRPKLYLLLSSHTFFTNWWSLFHFYTPLVPCGFIQCNCCIALLPSNR